MLRLSILVNFLDSLGCDGKKRWLVRHDETLVDALANGLECDRLVLFKIRSDTLAKKAN
jgi:hypothetical protein